jgi:hypothetical protein
MQHHSRSSKAPSSIEPPGIDWADRESVVGFVGNCQAELLQKVFYRAVQHRKIGSFYHFFDISAPMLEQARQELEMCDILILQDIQDIEQYPLHESVPQHAQIIRIPFLRFAAPWPYDDFNGLRDRTARALDDPALHTTTYYDGMLSRLRRQMPDPQQRLNIYRNLDVADAIDPARVLDFEARRLESVDERFGISIGNFILSQFRNRQLFYTVNRPNGELLTLLMDHIANSIDLDLNGIPASQIEYELDELRVIQVPIHPLIARRLEISWANESTLYEINGQKCTWEDHVRKYIERYG